MTREPPNTAPEPTAAPLLPPSLRSYGGTGRSTGATVPVAPVGVPPTESDGGPCPSPPQEERAGERRPFVSRPTVHQQA